MKHAVEESLEERAEISNGNFIVNNISSLIGLIPKFAMPNHCYAIFFFQSGQGCGITKFWISTNQVPKYLDSNLNFAWHDFALNQAYPSWQDQLITTLVYLPRIIDDLASVQKPSRKEGPLYFFSFILDFFYPL